MPRINVVAGILYAPDKRILISERVDDGPFHGLWEFPGGKIASGESAEDALRRELREEIGIAVRRCQRFMQVRHDYPDRQVNLDFYKVLDWSGDVSGLEGQALRWLFPDEIIVEEMLPADAPVIEALRAPSSDSLSRRRA